MKSLTNNNIIICGHNSQAFDCVHFINALVLIKVHINEFHKVIFADTLPFYGLSTDRLYRKEKKLKLLYSQEALFHDIVGGGGGRTRVTNAISDVQSLQSIVAKCDQITLLANNHSFTFMSAVTHYTK